MYYTSLLDTFKIITGDSANALSPRATMVFITKMGELLHQVLGSGRVV